MRRCCRSISRTAISKRPRPDQTESRGTSSRVIRPSRPARTQRHRRGSRNAKYSGLRKTARSALDRRVRSSLHPSPCRISSAVEQRFCKPKVGGSIPSSGTIPLKYAPVGLRPPLLRGSARDGLPAKGTAMRRRGGRAGCGPSPAPTARGRCDRPGRRSHPWAGAASPAAAAGAGSARPGFPPGFRRTGNRRPRA